MFHHGNPGLAPGHYSHPAGSQGGIRREDGSPVPGLYAAGRTAVGICTNGYISGLSIADCVYSGRRAARALTA